MHSFDLYMRLACVILSYSFTLDYGQVIVSVGSTLVPALYEGSKKTDMAGFVSMARQYGIIMDTII